MTKRVDSEPITIYVAIAATYAASVATANYIKTHYGALPTRVRADKARKFHPKTAIDLHTHRGGPAY